MKRLALLIFLAVAGLAWGGKPSYSFEPTPIILHPFPYKWDDIDLRLQQTRIFRFDAEFNKVTLSADGIAQVTPAGSRAVRIRALTEGTTLMTAYGPDGKIVHRSNVVVMQTGGPVTIYGQGNSRTGQDNPRTMYCTDRQCRLEKEEEKRGQTADQLLQDPPSNPRIDRPSNEAPTDPR